MRPGVIVIVLLLVQSAAAELPSESDLRAAYCIPIVRHVISVFRSVEKDLRDFLSNEASNALLQGIQESSADLRRLQLYLMPRLPYLAPTGLTVAMKQAEEDLASLDAHAKQTCRPKCHHLLKKSVQAESSCTEKCMLDHPAHSHRQRCSDLRWLPY